MTGALLISASGFVLASDWGAVSGPSSVTTRRRPLGHVRVELGDPNHVHFHLPDDLRQPAQEEVTSVDLVLTMTDHHL
jgi:hypothetical protein